MTPREQAKTPAAAGAARSGQLRSWDPLTASNVHTIAIGLSKDPNPKTTVLIFWPGASTPWGAAKLPCTDGARRAVAREGAFLLEVHRAFSGPVLHTIPRRLSSFETNLPDDSMVVSALGGAPMSVGYGRRDHLRRPENVRHDLAILSAWMREMQSTTTQAHGPIELCEPILSRLRSRFGSEPITDRVVRALEPVARNLANRAGPKTVVHGDLWLGNVLVDDTEVTGVVDWESAELTGEPLRDVARFGLTYALYLDRRTRPGGRIRGHGIRAASWGIGVTHVMTGDGWFPDLLRGYFRSAMARLGADPASWRGLVLLGLADVAGSADDDAFAHRHLVLLDQLKETVR
ncbi:MAG: hypothetical protein QOJ62_133 [Actinomycetota bacterium]|jgi:hypothetical protein|nr:hypothetical protein [Actinomycetota bacterium]